MIKNKKITRAIILCGVLAITLLMISWLTTYLRKDSLYYANQFLEKLTNPEGEASTKYYRDLFHSKETSRDTVENYTNALKEEYGDLMTDKAFDKATANRFIPWGILIEESSHHAIKVDSFELKEIQVYDDGDVHYGYCISLRILFSNGEIEAHQVSGDLVMTEEDDGWKVAASRMNSDYQGLYKNLHY